MHNKKDMILFEIVTIFLIVLSPFLSLLAFQITDDLDYQVVLTYLAFFIPANIACLLSKILGKSNKKYQCLIIFFSPLLSVLLYFFIGFLFNGNFWYALSGGLVGLFIPTFIYHRLYGFNFISKK